MSCHSSSYEAPQSALVILINETVNGPPERRLAAKFVLDCLRRSRSHAEFVACLDELEHHASLDIALTARKLASGLNLIA